MGKGNRPRLRRRHRGDPLVAADRAAVLQVLQGGNGAGRQAHGRQELERACAKALSYSPRPSYKTIKSIIAKSAEPSGEDPDVGAYLRGSDYYTTLESKGDVR